MIICGADASYFDGGTCRMCVEPCEKELGHDGFHVGDKGFARVVLGKKIAAWSVGDKDSIPYTAGNPQNQMRMMLDGLWKRPIA